MATVKSVDVLNFDVLNSVLLQTLTVFGVRAIGDGLFHSEESLQAIFSHRGLLPRERSSRPGPAQRGGWVQKMVTPTNTPVSSDPFPREIWSWGMR